jgi:hypothetical protein
MLGLRHSAGSKIAALLGVRQLAASGLLPSLPKHRDKRAPGGCEAPRSPARRRSISRTRLATTTTAAMMGVALAGCSSISTTDWSKPKPPPTQSLQFQSEPPGADVRTAQGQTCQTPCSLAVPPEGQSVTIAKNGYLSQTVQIHTSEPAKHSIFSKSTAPALIPNPVTVALQPTTPPPEPTTNIPPPKPVTKQEPAQPIKHYWPASAPMTQQQQ